MINGVLVERTVKDVIPALRTNSEGLKKVLDELIKQYKKQQDDMEKWKVSPRIHFPRSPCHCLGKRTGPPGRPTVSYIISPA